MQTYRRKVFLGFGASLFLMVIILSLAIFLILRLGSLGHHFAGKLPQHFSRGKHD